MNLSSVNLPPLYGILVALVPSFIFLVILILPYEEEVEDEVLYRGFFYGFFLGFIAYLLERLGFFGYGQDPGIAFYSIFGLSVIHPMILGMILNKKEHQEKRQTIALGAALGFGFSSIYGFTIFAGALLLGDIETPYEQFLGIFYVLGTILLLGATGVVIGYGVLVGEYKRYLGIIIVIHLVPNIAKFIRAASVIPQEALTFFLFAYGALAYLLVRRDFMPYVSESFAKNIKAETKLIIKKKLD